jgi:hypothetical protein
MSELHYGCDRRKAKELHLANPHLNTKTNEVSYTSCYDENFKVYENHIHMLINFNLTKFWF